MMYERIVIVLAVISATSSRPDESIVNGDQTASESAISWAEKAAKGVGNFFSKAGDEISGTAVEAWNATQDKAGEVADVLNGAAGTVAEHGERLAGEAKTWATGAVETVKREGEKAANATGDALIGFGETVKQGAQEGVKTVGDAVQGEDGEKNVLGKIRDWFSGLGK
ncbi:hypothetical protein RB195_016586 [Necator americanus]|uniref:Late embryogeneis abundant protein n=1 Tax=Necator americanus TaxID=51031 RepID=A0ABR1C4D4_NECAM